MMLVTLYRFCNNTKMYNVPLCIQAVKLKLYLNSYQTLVPLQVSSVKEGVGGL